MVIAEFGQKEAESCEKAYDKEEYERVGYREKKACDEFAPLIGGFDIGRFKRTGRIFT